jgi:hypothetical protein
MRAGSIEQLLSTHSGLLSPNMIQLQKRQNIFDEGEGENDFDSFDVSTPYWISCVYMLTCG